MKLRLYVQPGASRSGVIGAVDGRLKIAVKAAPVDGKANDELIRFVAAELSVTRRDIRLTAGTNGRRKTIEIPDDTVVPEDWQTAVIG